MKRLAHDTARLTGGRLMSRDSDVLMRVVTTRGVLDLEVHDPGERSIAASHWNAVKGYLGDDETVLLPFAKLTVAGYELETDLDVIDIRESEGDLDIEHIYPTRES